MISSTEVAGEKTKVATGATKIKEHILEIVSDSGEGAQKAGQSFGALSAKMGNGVWTVEIIPAEIQPPARTREGASGIRIRFGTDKITNMGNEANVVVAFNEQVPYGRIEQGAYKEGTIMIIESKWATHESESIRKKYADALAEFKSLGYDVRETPMEEECLKFVKNPKKGKNMWVLGMLCYMYTRDISRAEAQIAHIFRKKAQKIVDSNIELLHAGYNWAKGNLGLCYEVPTNEITDDLVVMNGNEAIGMGTLAAGIELLSMYPITPATSVSHHLAECFEASGGIIHQAEDEIAAVGFAIGASYAGKTAMTVTSGPGIALKTEFLGLASMAEVPLVVVNVQRGGPSTGLPTKVEQSDLLAILYGQTGDAPKIVIAASTIEECFQFTILARKIAESFRTPVYLLTDANLATGVQPFPRPKVKRDWFAAPLDQSPWKEGLRPFDWDEETGLSSRPIPGQKGGRYTLTGLAHNFEGKVCYNPDNNQKTSELRSKKLATFKNTLKPPTVTGDESGDLLIVAWGSTRGAVEEAAEIVRKDGGSVSTVHLRFLSPLEPGLKDIFKKFKKVMTIEINYSDDPTHEGVTEDNRRYSQLAWMLRARTLVDIDCWSNVKGQPLGPNAIVEKLNSELALLK